MLSQLYYIKMLYKIFSNLIQKKALIDLENFIFVRYIYNYQNNFTILQFGLNAAR